MEKAFSHKKNFQKKMTEKQEKKKKKKKIHIHTHRMVISKSLLLSFTGRVKVTQSLHRPWGFQEVQAPRFIDNRHMKVVRMQPYAPAALTS